MSQGRSAQLSSARAQVCVPRTESGRAMTCAHTDEIQVSAGAGGGSGGGHSERNGDGAITTQLCCRGCSSPARHAAATVFRALERWTGFLRPGRAVGAHHHRLLQFIHVMIGLHRARVSGPRRRWGASLRCTRRYPGGGLRSRGSSEEVSSCCVLPQHESDGWHR
jgi:hypothetical protein